MDLLEQNQPPKRVVVVDDCSPIRADVSLAQIVSSTPIDIYRLEENIGLGASRADGFRLITTLLTLVVDADD